MQVGVSAWIGNAARLSHRRKGRRRLAAGGKREGRLGVGSSRSKGNLVSEKSLRGMAIDMAGPIDVSWNRTIGIATGARTHAGTSVGNDAVCDRGGRDKVRLKDHA